MKGFGLSLLRLWKWCWRTGPMLVGGLVVWGAGAAIETFWPWLPGSEVATAGALLGGFGLVVWGVRHFLDLPRAFRTADLWLIHAADCCSRYSSWTCCGVRY